MFEWIWIRIRHQSRAGTSFWSHTLALRLDAIRPSIPVTIYHNLAIRYNTWVSSLSPPRFLSFLFTLSTPFDSMDFTFGGKYRLEEELAIGGCGPSSFLFCCGESIDWHWYRDGVLRRTQSGWAKKGDLNGSLSGEKNTGPCASAAEI